MTTEGRPTIATSRALYFSDLTPQCDSSDTGSEGGSSTDDSTGRPRKPSYVSLSHAINGYTPYAPYNGRVKKISPPLQIPVTGPQTLDSVTLVLSQDGYSRSVQEFESVMRDLSMAGVQRNQDMTDHARIIPTNGENFFPKTHSKQIISDGDRQSVEIVTKFHSDSEHSPTYSPNGSRQNLVAKQIERLYGDTHCQLRMTSPEPKDGENEVTPSNGHSEPTSKPERKLSGGFFAKRFGISKMKDHSTRKLESADSSAPTMDFKPLKVPAVFRLLRPEFREQLKQSSCKVAVPGEDASLPGRQERIIPIRRETDNSFTHATTPTTTPTTTTTPIAATKPAPSSAPATMVSNNSSTVIPIRRESGDITSTPRRPAGLVPKVNGFNKPAGIPGLRTNGAPAPETKVVKQESNGVTKQTIARKLSPLSPKHIVGLSSAEKPATMPKPEHLKSPPMSPVPASSPASESPPNGAASPVPAICPLASSPAEPDKPAELQSPPTQPEAELHQAGGRLVQQSLPHLPPATTTLVSPANLNNNHKEEVGEQEEGEEYDQPEEYPEEFYYNNPPCGLRERELLCPIMEEDNESTASGSVHNLSTSSAQNNTVIGE